MSKAQRDKGKRYEREVAKRFAELFHDAKRTGWMQVESDQPDVKAGPFWIECKFRDRPNPIKALLQAEKTCPCGYVPLSSCKVTNGPHVITMFFDDFMDFCSEFVTRGEIK